MMNSEELKKEVERTIDTFDLTKKQVAKYMNLESDKLYAKVFGTAVFNDNDYETFIINFTDALFKCARESKMFNVTRKE